MGVVGQDVPYVRNIFSIIYIHFKIGFEVYEKNIVDRCHNAFVLFIIENAEVWGIDQEIF